MKRIINSILLISLLVSIITVFNPANVYACSCVEPLSVEEEFNRSEAVFAGRVLEVREHNPNGYMTKSVLFEVSRIWKGGSESQIIIHTGGGGGDCGYFFEAGKEYLVYANQSTMYGNKEQLVSIICSRTNILAQAKEDLTILGEGKAPTEQVDLEEEPNPPHSDEGHVPTKQINFKEEPKLASSYVWFLVIGFVVLGGGVILAWRIVRK